MMIVRCFHYPYEIDSELRKRRIVPMAITRVKIKEGENQNRYLYVFKVSYLEIWFLDTATDYSGGGGEIFRGMEKLVKFLLDNYPSYIAYSEYEMDGDLYSLLKYIFTEYGYILHAQGENK